MSLPKIIPAILVSGRLASTWMKMRKLLYALILGSGLFCLSGHWQQAHCALEGSLSANTTWVASESPYIIEGDLRIPAGITLAVEPGTKVLFQRGASLLIEGDIIAIGTLERPILFSSNQPQPAPGDWGNLRFITADTTLSYDEEGNYIKGSRMEYCIVEYGGRPVKVGSKDNLGGAIHCRKSSPYLKNLIIRYNHSLQGGGIYCHEFASPYICQSLFLENRADESGGGLACFFYSNAVVKENIFQANRAGENGGGIYFSFSSPQIVGNIIENCYAGVHGGGLYCSNTVTQAISRVRRNVFLSNRSEYKANNIYLTAKIETIFQENCLIAGEGYEIVVSALEKDLDMHGNYFGPPSKSDIEARVFDGYDDPNQRSVLYDPVLDTPPSEIPNAPQDISYFNLAGDQEYTTKWDLPLCDEAPVFLEVRAQDRNPYHADWIPIRLRSSESNPMGIVVLAWETGPSTGIFRLKGKIASHTFAKDATIKAKAGEIVFFSVEGVEGFEISRPVETAKSYITVLMLPDEMDSLHVVNHLPVVAWSFLDIFQRKQERYQIQISQESPFLAPPIWDSGEILSAETKGILEGCSLSDGETYGLRLRMFNGIFWSDWEEMTIRLNSLPDVPVPLSPQNGIIVNQIRPAISVQASTDAEGDPIYYEFQIYQDAGFVHIMAIEKELQATGDKVLWMAPADLSDDAEYYWRARSRDPYETGPWTSTGQFWVNLVEEPPMPFGLLDPEIGSETYLLQPVFSWEKTFDPDPLSTIYYRVLYSRNPDFKEAATKVLETDLTFIKTPEPLKNGSIYYWKVEAVDNTKRVTTSNEVGSFFVNTTPTKPEIVHPIVDAELRPADRISWTLSTDPDPTDIIQYRLQIARENFNTPLIDEVCANTIIALHNLTQFNKLIDNTLYHLRLRAEDNHGVFSDWSELEGEFFCNTVNNPPGRVASPITPDGGVITDPLPILSWGAARDDDRSDPVEKLSYLIQLDKDGDFSAGARQVQVIAGVTQATIPGLEDNQRWFYRICARDDDGALSEWSDVKMFVLNTQNDPPNPFDLIAIDNGTRTYQLTGIEFSWEPATDPDPGDSLIYWFNLVRVADGSPVTAAKKMAGTSYKLVATLANASEYEWWVETEDRAGLRTPSSSRFRFFVDTTPTAPTGVLIASVVLTSEEAITWQLSTDPDPADVLTYELRISAGNDPENAEISMKNISANEVAKGVPIKSAKGMTAQQDNLQYFVFLRAEDSHGAFSLWSQSAAFYLDLKNEPPETPTLQEPAAGVSRTTKLTLHWSAAVDPDPADAPETIRYQVQAVPGRDFKVKGVVEISIEPGNTSLQNLELTDNQLWNLRVRALDVRGAVSQWSPVVEIIVNVQEEPPSSPEISGPKIGAVFSVQDPVKLAWTESSDPDYGASVSYEVRWWLLGSPGDKSSYNTGSETSYQLSGLTGDQSYSWQVAAIDETGLETLSAIQSFRVEIPNHPPQGFDLRSPEDGTENVSSKVNLSWGAAVDNDPNDEVQYTLYLARDASFSADVKTFANLKGTDFTLSESLEYGTTYYWKVLAIDRKGERVWSGGGESHSFQFTIEPLPEVQEPVEGEGQ